MKAILESDQERMEAVWRQRAVRLSRRPLAARTAETDFQVIVLEIGDDRYGIELADVAEVLPPVQVTLVPGAPTFFSGVVNVHGEIRPVADLRRLLGMETTENHGLARVILLRKQGRELGLRVDRVERIRSVASRELQPADGSNAGLSARYLKGLTQDALMLISTEALFAELLVAEVNVAEVNVAQVIKETTP
jgi:purine-binding chemotaxis protein CheW